MIGMIAVLSITLGVFNILPIPPMDGFKVLFSFATDETYFKLLRYERYGMLLILVLSISGRLWGPLNTAVDFLLGHLSAVTVAGIKLAQLFM
jgi:Zn-dependent protease